MDKKLLRKRLNTARKERGWTSERLSEACNINATYLRQIESGAKVPSLQVFVLLCEALKVSPTYLLAEVLPSMELQNMDVLFGTVANCHAKANHYDDLHDPQCLGSIEGLTEMRLAGGAFFSPLIAIVELNTTIIT